jgi:hypothetical protein
MLFDGQVLAFCAVAALVTISPGPDIFLVIRNTLGGVYEAVSLRSSASFPAAPYTRCWRRSVSH